MESPLLSLAVTDGAETLFPEPVVSAINAYFPRIYTASLLLEVVYDGKHRKAG
jgi:hypothetical protein